MEHDYFQRAASNVGVKYICPRWKWSYMNSVTWIKKGLGPLLQFKPVCYLQNRFQFSRFSLIKPHEFK